MPKIGIIRCEKNADKCPLTACFAAMAGRKAAFEIYEEHCVPAGVFTCRCPGDGVVEMANILKKKGTEVIHFCTCTFATRTGEGWSMENGGFCEDINKSIARVHEDTGIPCVKGTAHLPRGYEIQKWG